MGEEKPEQPEIEPAGSREIAEACRPFLEPEDVEELASMDAELCLENAFLWLLQSPNFRGDPEEYFKEKGILE